MHYFEISLILFIIIGLSLIALSVFSHMIIKKDEELDEKIERNAMDLKLHKWSADHRDW